MSQIQIHNMGKLTKQIKHRCWMLALVSLLPLAISYYRGTHNATAGTHEVND